MTSTLFKGLAYKIGYHDDVDLYLNRGDQNRPMGRYNAPGQDAFYASESVEAAEGALRNLRPDPKRAQVLLRYDIEADTLFDVRSATEAQQSKFLAPWKPVVAEGQRPPNWDAADDLRARGFNGLIDQSRANPNLFHLVLFHWNAPDKPRISLLDMPEPYQS